MKRMTFNHLFYIKRTRLIKNGKTPIFLRITVNGMRVDLSTHRSVHPDLWNQDRQSSNGKNDDAYELNEELKVIERKIFRYKRELEEKNLPLTASAIKDLYLGKSKENAGIVEIFQDHNRRCKELIGTDYAAATVTRYETTLKHLLKYIEGKYKVQDIPAKLIGHEFIKGFEHYLKTKKVQCAHNSTVKYIRNFRKIIREALDNEWIQKDPFRHIKYRLKEVDREYLTHPELMLIINKRFNIDRLEQVKDIFVFCCFTGLAYAEMQNLCTDHLQVDIEGTKWIQIIRKKTGRTVRIPLLDVAVSILDKYKEHPLCVRNAKLLPVLSNQKMNAYLKEIADLCGIRKDITTHTARHTWASTVALANGIPMEIVSNTLGHSNVIMTQHYAKVGDPVKKSYLPLINSIYGPSVIDKTSEKDQLLNSGSK